MSDNMIDHRWGMKFMLQPHEDAIEESQRKSSEKEKTELDEQQLEEFEYAIEQSLVESRRVKIFEFDKFEDVEREGIVTEVNLHLKKLRLDSEESFEWINIDDITNILLLQGGVID